MLCISRLHLFGLKSQETTYEYVSGARETPLLATHREEGGRLVEFAGWKMPVQYEGIAAEHEAVRKGVSLTSLIWGRFVLEGVNRTIFTSCCPHRCAGFQMDKCSIRPVHTKASA